ncbi:MAG: hypothetical protein M3R01_03015, partial [Actinomycetota bacterium]|nr:hypothetical protein [Actinomycetota bacterium]
MPEPDPVESSPAGARLARWAGGDRNLALLAATVAVLPLVVGMVRVLVDGQFALHGDDALIELRVRDVGSHTPLVGSYQRFGWNHPGPLLFYLLAAPYRLLGSDFSGLQVGALAVNALSVVGIGFVAQRRGGLPLLLWSLALVALLVHAIGPVDLSDPWEPDVSVLPVTLLVFLAWDVASGRVWALPVVAAVASLLVQAYAVLAPVTLALSGGAAVTLAVGWLRDRRRAPADRRWRGAMAAGIVAGLV